LHAIFIAARTDAQNDDWYDDNDDDDHSGMLDIWQDNWPMAALNWLVIGYAAVDKPHNCSHRKWEIVISGIRL